MVKNIGNVLGLLQMEKRPQHPSPSTIDKSTQVFKKIHSYSVKIPDNYFDVQSDPRALQYGKHISDDDKRKQLNELMDIYYQVEYNKMVANGQVQPAFTPNPFDNELNFTHGIDLYHRKKREKLVHSIYKKDNQEQSTQTTSKPLDMGTQEEEVTPRVKPKDYQEQVKAETDRWIKLAQKARAKAERDDAPRTRQKSKEFSDNVTLDASSMTASAAPKVSGKPLQSKKVIPGTLKDLGKAAVGDRQSRKSNRLRGKPVDTEL